MTAKGQDTFCKRMRKATRNVHAISDTLVNTKLSFGLFDNSVWADGLLVFYEIFRYLEQSSTTKWQHTKIGLFPLDKLRRTEAFERDLEFYLGKEWRKGYSVRESVAKYLEHLKEIENADPDLLIPYIYHLYMGLLSGGIILRKKRQLVRKVWPFGELANEGSNVTDFGDNNVFELKRRMRDAMNEIGDALDEDTKNKLIEESKMVFALNNEIIKSVRGVGTSLLKKIFFLVLPIALLLLAVLLPSKR